MVWECFLLFARVETEHLSSVALSGDGVISAVIDASVKKTPKASSLSIIELLMKILAFFIFK